MHHDEHHGSSCEVVEVGRDEERGQRQCPQYALRVARVYPFLYEVEAAVILKDLNDGHRGQEEHDDAGGTANVPKEYVVVDIGLDGMARRRLSAEELGVLVRVLRHDKVGAPADVYHPPYCSDEHGDGSLVDTRHVTGGNQQVAQNQQYNNQ